jgi:hypothetical protein
MDEPENDGAWIIAKLVTGDYCLKIKLVVGEGLPEIFPVSRLTKLIFNPDGNVQYGLWGPEKLHMTDGIILMRKEAILTFCAASEAMINDVEKAWGIKPNIIVNKKTLVLP